MQPCATSRSTINSYRFCSWEQVPWEPSKYCSFAYREEPNRNVLSPCFSLVFKGVAGVLISSHITAPLLDSFFIRYAQSKQKATYWRIWNIRRDTKRRGAAYRVTSELNECVWKLYRTAAHVSGWGQTPSAGCIVVKHRAHPRQSGWFTHGSVFRQV